MAISKAQKVRNLLDQGISPKDIARKLRISPQAVYNIRYQYNKKNGLGSLRVQPTQQKPIVVPEKEERGGFVEVKNNESETNPMWWLIAVVAVATLLAIVIK